MGLIARKRKIDIPVDRVIGNSKVMGSILRESIT